MRILVALPATLLGLAFAFFAWRDGARVRVCSGVVEVWGGGARRIADRLAPDGWRIRSLALGHVVIARDAVCLESTRAHERKHVRQYERWGVALLPAYVAAGFAASLRGGEAYRDCVFEQRARRC